MYINEEIDQYVFENPSDPIKRNYNQKELELVAEYWPEYESRDSGLMKKKNRLVPNLPNSTNDLEDLPEDYKLTTSKQRFLASPIELFSKIMLLISLIGLKILGSSKNGDVKALSQNLHYFLKINKYYNYYLLYFESG